MMNINFLQILNDELGPKISKLKEERQQFMEYQRVDRELQHCRKIYTAYKYVTALNQSKKANEDLKMIEDRVSEMQQNIKDGERESKIIDEKIQEVTNRKNNVHKNNRPIY